MLGGSWVPCKVVSQRKSGLNQEQRNLGSFEAQFQLEEASWWDLIQPSTISKATAKEAPSATCLIHPSEVGDPPEVTGMPAPAPQLPGQDRGQLMELVFKMWMHYLRPGPQGHPGMVQTHSGTVNANQRSEGASPGIVSALDMEEHWLLFAEDSQNTESRSCFHVN